MIDHSSVKKEHLLHIHEYFMVKNNEKQCLDLSRKCLLDY